MRTILIFLTMIASTSALANRSPCMAPSSFKTYEVKALDKLTANTIDPRFKAKAKEVIEILRTQGFPLRIVWVTRTKAENDKLVNEGKASKKSLHLKGLAMDLICNRTGRRS